MHIPGHIPGLLVAVLWSVALTGIVADVLIKSETSWISDLVRDLTHVFIGLGVAALMMWHRDRSGAGRVGTASLTRAALLGIRIGWFARAQMEAAQEGAEVVQLRPRMEMAFLHGGRLTGGYRHE